ncbi:hypothetical protein OL229_20305 [Neisseriaceae bacterium JH1-16]|nr:hypothetical protein [Neisseriaceae bacterium JH1-16]
MLTFQNRVALAAQAILWLACAAAPTQFARASGTFELSQSLAEHQIDPTRMNELRGGMQINGLNVDLGIERAVYVNGVLQATGNYQWNNGGTSILSSAPGTLVVQNSVPHQALQVTTTVNLEVTNLAMYRAMRNTESLTQAIIGGIH